MPSDFTGIGSATPSTGPSPTGRCRGWRRFSVTPIFASDSASGHWQFARRHDLDAFVRGFAHEAIARAAAEVDDVETFTEHLELAKALLPDIEDTEDRDILAADLAEMSEE